MTDELLAELARDRGRALLAYACLLTADRAAGQDLVQDAFVRVFDRARSGLTADSAEAYLRRTILNLYVDGFRRRRLWGEVSHLVAGRDAHPSAELPVVDRIDLLRAMTGLSPQERTVVVLRFFEDLPLAEVADSMGLALGTVKRYLHDALHKLETELGPLDVDLGEDMVAVGVLPTERTPRRRS